MGGKPSRATPADQRLKRNNPNAGKKTAPTPPPMPAQPSAPAQPKQTGKKGGK